MKYLIAILVLGGLAFGIYHFIKSINKRNFITRPERGKVRDILRKTNQISEKKREELEAMDQTEVQHELNKSFKKMNKIFKEKKNERKP